MSLERSCWGWPSDGGGNVLRRHLEQCGFREDCEDCRYAVAYGREACALHYVPVAERTPEREQGELFEGTT